MKQATKKTQSVQTTPKARVLSGDDHMVMLESLQEAISRRAYEIFESRGSSHGRDTEDWARAAEEILLPLPGNTTEDSRSITLRCFVQAAQDVAIAIEPRRVIVWMDSETEPETSAGQKSAQATKALQFEFPNPVDSSRPTIGLSGQILTITVPKAAVEPQQPAV